MAEINQWSGMAIDAAFKVHSALGPGLLESVYEACLAKEFELRNMPFTRQMALPITYEGLIIDNAYRIDFCLAQSVIVEVKAVEKMIPVFDAQLLTYMRLTGCTVGLLINFNVPRIKEGIKRMIL